ncbi:ankyrin repeat domain-containing protein [Rhodopirellula sp. MGV]|uniref:ankyrin repeat domain-containing protein n=1 Tax=Rhodopirellula sp. MGV TaxID=2023130 RepID=UPI000B974FB7|nr:ankyrin repeat domain-containing protein [Rhodopirellula sp. MGV]OYP28934.1 hypothetical protein CGZ80_25550 [Rhodopirellula sp. MGV]PNY36949.1 hypothetical protein C2E31_10055 [Rhodopirellula baltica]
MFRFLALTVVFFIAFAAAIVFLFSDSANNGESELAAIQQDNDVQVADGEIAAKRNSEVTYTPEAFRKAAFEGNIEIVKSCIGKGVEIDDADSSGFTALTMAAYNGHDKVCQVLIEAGADVNKRDNKGQFPLYHAASLDSPTTVKLLLDAGAEINETETRENFTSLMMAAAEGNMGVVKVLLEAGADRSMRDVDGDRALEFAREYGHEEIAQLLQEN